MAEAEDFANYLKTTKYPTKYIDIFGLSNSDGNLIANVVPLECDDFFAPKVCNFIILTGGYNPDNMDAAKARISAVYDQFTKYETHIIVDGSSENISCMTDDQKDDLSSKISSAISGLPGFSYHGVLESTALPDLIDSIVTAFYE